MRLFFRGKMGRPILSTLVFYNTIIFLVFLILSFLHQYSFCVSYQKLIIVKYYVKIITKEELRKMPRIRIKVSIIGILSL